MPPLATDLYPASTRLNGLWNNANNTKQLIVEHTTESEGGNDSVISYLERTKAGSYQTMHDFDGEEVRMVPDDKQSWAAMGQGNARGLHSCAMGRAEWSRERWLQEGKLLESTARRWATWHREHGIPLVRIGPDEVRKGVRGVCGHKDISDAFGESDHWDPGPNFPYDVVIARAKEIVAGDGGTEGDDMANADQVYEQFQGPADEAGVRRGWKPLRPIPNKLGHVYSVFKNRLLGADEGQTVVEALASLVFEATLRIPPYRGPNLRQLPDETVLGHAAAAHGAGLDALDQIGKLQVEVVALKETVATLVTALSTPKEKQ